VKVRHDEGVANRIDPEPCDAIREGCVEASVGERIGQPWSRERLKVSGADVVRNTEGDMDERVSASGPPSPAWSKTLACVEALCTGTGRSRVWPAEGCRRSASGRRGVVAADARTREV